MIEFNKIFGIGVDRTGTTSLTAALNILGINTMHKPQFLVGVLETERRLRLKPLSTFPEYRGFTDNPIPNMYEELDREYPGSKFIVTIRDFDSWFQSKKNLTIWQKRMFDAKAIENLKFDKEQFRISFALHYQKIREYFIDRGDDLLWLDLCSGEGWAKWAELCEFLEVKLPKAGFPHKNISNTLSKG